MAWARIVAVVVPSPATSEVFDATSRTIWAPMFSSGSFNSISFATVTPSLVMVGPPYFFSRIQNAANVVLAHDDVLSANHLRFSAGVLPKEDAIADLDVEGHQRAILEPLAMTYCHDFTLLRLFLSRIGDDNAAARGFLLVDPLHHNAVV